MTCAACGNVLRSLNTHLDTGVPTPHRHLSPSSSISPGREMPSLTFTDPPTPDTLHHAQLHLQSTLEARLALETKIRDAESALAQLVNEAQCAITKMSNERKTLEAETARTKAYLSPVRRLPAEMLREIFMWNFEEHAACAWVLSAVCSSWRRLAIRTPRLWSKVR